MKTLKLATLAFTLVSSSAMAKSVDLASCESVQAKKSVVVGVQKYANESIQIFAIDRIVPGTAPYAVAIQVERADEKLCAFADGFSDLDLQHAVARYTDYNDILKVEIPVTTPEEPGKNLPSTLTIKVKKSAKLVSDVISVEN